METENNNQEIIKGHYQKQNSSKKLFGLIFIAAGTLWALREGGVDMPSWLYSWGLLLIAIGLVNGFKHNFKLGGWLIPTLIGAVFFADEFYPLNNVHAFLWPMVLVAVGVIMIFKPKQKFTDMKGGPFADKGVNDQDYVEVTTIMAGAEKKIVSQNFRGGEVTSILGGSELNFLNADLKGVAILNVTCVMGGSKLTIPSNWLVKSEVTAIMGGVEDKRLLDVDANPDKVLILKGTALMGGIEVISH